jgi:flagellar motor switch protein FliN/FliY
MTQNETGEDDAVDFVAIEDKQSGRRSAVLDVPVEIFVSVGSARLTVHELMSLQKDQIVPLSAKIADPVDILVGEKLVARGELVDLDGDDNGIGVRITDIAESAKAA